MATLESSVQLWPRLCTRLFSWMLARQFREFGEGARVSPPFRFHGLNQISVGDNVIIHRDCWIHVVGGQGDDKSPRIIIKSNSGIGMGATISAAQQIVIGEHVLLARNVYISDHGHAFEDISKPIMDQGINNIKPVHIGKHTWLGQNVAVLPGVTIGEHCIIGVNSVVNRSIPDYSVAVGAPARVVKRFNQDIGRWERVA